MLFYLWLPFFRNVQLPPRSCQQNSNSKKWFLFFEDTTMKKKAIFIDQLFGGKPIFLSENHFQSKKSIFLPENRFFDFKILEKKVNILIQAFSCPHFLRTRKKRSSSSEIVEKEEIVMED